MPRILPGAAEALRLAQTEFALPDELAARLLGCEIRTVRARRSKGGWATGSNVSQNDSVLRESLVLENGHIVVVTGAPDSAGQELGAPAEEEISAGELALAIGKLKRQLLKDVFVLLASGNLLKADRRLLERIEGALQDLERLMTMHVSAQQAIPEQPKPEEIARILKKMENRIHDLADQKYAQLVEEKLQSKRAAKDRKGMDVRGKAEARSLGSAGGMAGDGRTGSRQDEAGG